MLARAASLRKALTAGNYGGKSARTHPPCELFRVPDWLKVRRDANRRTGGLFDTDSYFPADAGG